MNPYNPVYVEVAKMAAVDEGVFSRFKREPAYRVVLEHISDELGGQYLELISHLWPELLDRMEEFKANDKIGNPYLADYPGLGKISPTTLRYIKVACDLRRLFGDLTGMHVGEIGGGYGGQFLICDILWRFGSWNFFDLDPVLKLTNRYLGCHSLRSPYKAGGRGRPRTSYDLVISNYAFCELDFVMQAEYFSTLLMNSSRGYLTINSEVIPEVSWIPGYRKIEEAPLTRAGNYIAVWGAK